MMSMLARARAGQRAALSTRAAVSTRFASRSAAAVRSSALVSSRRRFAGRVVATSQQQQQRRRFSGANAGAAGASSRSLFVGAAAAAVAAVAATSLAVLRSRDEKQSPLANLLGALPVAHAETPKTGVPGTKYERTFIACKPDAVNRGIVGEIISRFEKKGYKLVAMKLLTPSKDLAEAHYQDLSKKPFFGGLIRFFTSGPVVAMVWEGKGSVAGGRRLLGETDPAKSAPGSIRGDLCVDVGRNICHGSDSTDSAIAEINFWFKDSEVYDYVRAESTWVYEK